MRMDEGIDTGDIIEQAEYELAPDETAEACLIIWQKWGLISACIPWRR